MKFFNETEDLKEFVGGAVNTSLRIASIRPSIKTAYRKHLTRYIPADLLTRLLAEAPAPTLNTAETAAKEMLLEAVGYLGVYEYSYVGAMQFSENGAVRVESDSHKTAYKYQTQEHRAAMLAAGLAGLELLIVHLRNNRDSILTYKDSIEEADAFSRIVNLAKDFRRAYSTVIDRVAFESLLSVIEDVETFALIPQVGLAFYQEMQQTILGTEENADEKRQVLRLMQRVVCNFAIDEGLRRNLVQLSGSRVVVRELLGDQGSEKQGIPTEKKLGITISQAELTANRYVHELHSYLAANEDKFPTYKAHLATLAEADAAEEEEIDTRNFPCGCHNRCSCADHCRFGGGRRKENQGVVRL